jgi:uncharacterized protein YkwD
MLSLFLIIPFWLNSINPTPPPGSSDIEAAVVQSETVQSPESSSCSPQNPPSVNINFEQEVIDLVNAERISHGIAPLKRVNQLDNASRYHAADMEQDDYFSHDTYDRVNGDLHKSCDWFTRIDGFYRDRSWLGENIALGYSSPSSVMDAWMNSPGHRENILREEYWEIGVGYSSGNQWVQDFGQRPGIYPIIINNEAATTDNPIVSIFLYGDSNTWEEIRLRNNNDPWSDWTAFQNNLTWQLPDIAGEHVVTVEMRNKDTSSTSYDSIYLDIPADPELGNIPDEIVFTYSIPDGRSAPTLKQITPLNIANDTTLTWEVISDIDWLTISPETGSTPDPISLRVSGVFSNTATPYAGSVNIAVDSPVEDSHSPHVIAVNLNFVDVAFDTLYLPTVLR